MSKKKQQNLKETNQEIIIFQENIETEFLSKDFKDVSKNVLWQDFLKMDFHSTFGLAKIIFDFVQKKAWAGYASSGVLRFEISYNFSYIRYNLYIDKSIILSEKGEYYDLNGIFSNLRKLQTEKRQEFLEAAKITDVINNPHFPL